MNTISSLNPFTANPKGLALDSDFYNQAKLTQAAISSEQSMEITIVTDQKDIVTLSFEADFDTTYTTYEGLATSQNGYAAIEGKQLSYEISVQQSVQVEGDLNRQEVRDIKKVMHQIGRMMKKFLAGKIDDVAEKAQSLLQNSNSLERVDAVWEFEKSASVLSQSQAEAAIGESRAAR